MIQLIGRIAQVRQGRAKDKKTDQLIPVTLISIEDTEKGDPVFRKIKASFENISAWSNFIGKYVRFEVIPWGNWNTEKDVLFQHGYYLADKNSLPVEVAVKS